MNRLSKYHRVLLVSFLAGVAAACAISLWQSGFRAPLAAWSNGFFAAAVLWCGAGLLLLISLFGGFDSFGYISYRLRRSFSRRTREQNPAQESYYDYTRRRREEKWDKFISSVALLPGIFYLAVAVVLTVLCSV